MSKPAKITVSLVVLLAMALAIVFGGVTAAAHADNPRFANFDLTLAAIPGDNVTSEVEMSAGETKSGNFTIGNNGVILGPKNGTATIRNGTITNNASNNKKGRYDASNGSAFIAQGANSLSFKDVTINSGPNILVFNIWSNASINAENVTLSRSSNGSIDTPFLMVGGYPNGAPGTLSFNGTCVIDGAIGSVVGGNGNSGVSAINVDSGTLTIKGSKIKMRDAAKIVVKSGTTLVVSDSSELKNAWIDNSGTVKIIGSDLENCVIKNRTGSTLSITDSKLHGSVRESQETMIHTEGSGSTITITNSEICDNKNMLDEEGASIIKVADATLTLNKVNVHGNYAKREGGAIYASHSTVKVDDDSTFTKNNGWLGGVFYLGNGSTAEIGKAKFEKNGCIIGDEFDYTRGTQDGGAIYVKDSSLVLKGTTFNENSVYGGSLASGGAIYANGSNAKLEVYGAKFTNNWATIHGGAITVAWGAHATILDLNGDPTEFKGNMVPFSTDFAGGALFINVAYVNMEDAAIYRNYATDAGGGIGACTTGTADIRVHDGAAIFDNEVGTDTGIAGESAAASKFADKGVQQFRDMYFQTADHIDHNTGKEIENRFNFPNLLHELYERMFNDGLHRWKVETFMDANDAAQRVKSLMGQSDPTNRDVSKAKVIFTENAAIRHPNQGYMAAGGAIGCNGRLEIGSTTDTEIKVVKVWEDDGNNDGKRPDPDTFKEQIVILADGKEISDETKKNLSIEVLDMKDHDVTLANDVVRMDGAPKDYSNKDAWVVIISGLPEKDKSDDTIDPDEYWRIVYTIDEESIPGYTLASSEGDMKSYFELTNTHEKEQTRIGVVKAWDDGENIDKLRPDAIEVTLKRNGDSIKTAKLDSSNGWTHDFGYFDVYDGGKKINYTVEETAIDGYASSVEVADTTETVAGAQKSAKIFTITNKHNVEQSVGSFKVSKRVAGTAADASQEFRFQVRFSNADGGNYGNAVPYKKEAVGAEGAEGTIKSDGEFTLKSGESIQFDYLPVGTNWTVKEVAETAHGYEILPAQGSVKGPAAESGTISEGECPLLSYTNEKDKDMGSLAISKEVAGEGADKQLEFSFKITIGSSAETDSDEAKEAEFAYTGSREGLVANGDIVKLRHGESITIEGLPAGTTFRVEELPAKEYESVSEGNEGTIATNETSKASFINKYTPQAKPESPRTAEGATPKAGDVTAITGFLSLTALAAAVLAAIAMRAIRSRR